MLSSLIRLFCSASGRAILPFSNRRDERKPFFLAFVFLAFLLFDREGVLPPRP
jgi:hypothetical protein